MLSAFQITCWWVFDSLSTQESLVWGNDFLGILNWDGRPEPQNTVCTNDDHWSMLNLSGKTSLSPWDGMSSPLGPESSTSRDIPGSSHPPLSALVLLQFCFCFHFVFNLPGSSSLQRSQQPIILHTSLKICLILFSGPEQSIIIKPKQHELAAIKRIPAN